MKLFISYEESRQLTFSRIQPVGVEILPLNALPARVLASDMISHVDSPSVDSSLKDGYAVNSADLEGASTLNPVPLNVIGSITAGAGGESSLSRGQAVQVTTGAPVPFGATAVLPEEFCQRKGNNILCMNTAEEGRNILERGTDIRKGEVVAARGEKLSPPVIGLMASAGLKECPVYKPPVVAVIATGDEVIAPGKSLPEGKLYASNMVEICSWLTLFGIPYYTEVAPDSRKAIAEAITRHLPQADAFITSGGAWGSERDFMIRVLDDLGWGGIYHRVRMGPGKAIAFGLLGKKPFFCLPGGPPSNEMAFLQITLPALMLMKGEPPSVFPVVRARLSETVRGDRDWTRFVHARIVMEGDTLMARPVQLKSRLQSMARKDALIMIPEGKEALLEGELIDVQVLHAFPWPPYVSR